MKQFFRTKSIDQLHVELDAPIHGKLRRSLGALDLVALGIGAIIGAGLFALIGTAAAGGPDHVAAGPAVSLSFVVTAIACVFCAFCYAEFAALVPIAGSAYTYSYATLGELMAWIIGWDLVLEYAVGSIAVSIGWSAYFRQLCAGLHIHIPAWLCSDYRSASQAAAAAAAHAGVVPSNLSIAFEAWQQHPTIFGIPIIFNMIAALIVLVITWLLVMGIKESARVNNFLVALKIVILFFFIGVGCFYIKPQNWSPFMPNGFHGVWVGASMIFFAFIGFDAVSTAAEECRNPGRDLPIGILGSLTVCTLIYVATAVVLTGIQPYQKLGVADPLAAAFANLGLNWIAGIVSLGAVIAMCAVLLVLLLGQSRILFSMSRDGLLPKPFAKVHSKYHTPYISTWLVGLLVATVAGATNITEIAELTNIGTLFAFVLVNIGIVVLRHTHPERRRVFRTPLVPWVPAIGVILCLYLMKNLPWITWLRFVLWLVVGLVLYFVYGSRHSKVKAATENTQG